MLSKQVFSDSWKQAEAGLKQKQSRRKCRGLILDEHLCAKHRRAAVYKRGFTAQCILIQFSFTCQNVHVLQVILRACKSVGISVHLNFVPLTLDAVSRLDENHTFVYSAIWLAHRDEREFVISSAWKQSSFHWQKQTAVPWCLGKSLQCLPRKGQGFAPNTIVKLKRALQIPVTAVWVRAIFFSPGFEFKPAMFTLDCNGKFLWTCSFVFHLQGEADRGGNVTLKIIWWRKKIVER